MDCKVSYAQFEDFPLKQRKHYSDHHDQLGDGLVPQADTEVLPHTLQRSRVAHDGAEMYADPDSFASTAQQSTGTSQWVSSYQAACHGNDELNPKKKTGRRILSVPGANAPSQTVLFGSGGYSTRPDAAGSLTAGTTKSSTFIPGYGGHIPVTTSQQEQVPARSLNKDLIVENYKPYGAGYTGKRR